MLIPTDKVIEALGDISIAGALHVGHMTVRSWGSMPPSV